MELRLADAAGRRRVTFPLKGGVAVVTGAASGIGASLAVVLAARGCGVALADVNASGLRDVADQARSHGVKVSEHRLDVADADAVAALPDAVLAEHGRVNVLVNNAGVALGGSFEQVSAADFDWLITINFGGVVRMTRAFLPLLRREPASQLVNISSVFGIVAPPGQTAYAASKFAVRGFSEALRHELEASSVGVTLVYPGGVRTAIATNARRTGMSNAETEAQAAIWAKFLRLDPMAAAERIVRGIELREKRVLVGRNAQRMTLIQRMFPVEYWRVIQRGIRT